METKPDARGAALAHFLRTAKPEERERCAALAGTSVAYLYQIAGGHREPRITLALQIERATQQLARETAGRLDVVTVSDLARN